MPDGREAGSTRWCSAPRSWTNVDEDAPIPDAARARPDGRHGAAGTVSLARAATAPAAPAAPAGASWTSGDEGPAGSFEDVLRMYSERRNQ
ncbi:MAG: hypothetical protein U0838_13295 [Chloroflexota bacterium]